MSRGGFQRPKGGRAPARSGATKGQASQSKHPETERHAQEVREVLRGRDIVELRNTAREVRPAAFQQSEMLFVRNWLDRRPLEAAPVAAALVHFPRMWTTRRGRYCRFVAPGAGSYGLVRARPSF